MPLLAICMPILPGKMEKWQAMMDHVKSTPEFSDSREAVGVHERTFVQRTPAGDLLIITLEGDDPAASWTKIMATMPPVLLNSQLTFMEWMSTPRRRHCLN